MLLPTRLTFSFLFQGPGLFMRGIFWCISGRVRWRNPLQRTCHIFLGSPAAAFLLQQRLAKRTKSLQRGHRFQLLSVKLLAQQLIQMLRRELQQVRQSHDTVSSHPIADHTFCSRYRGWATISSGDVNLDPRNPWNNLFSIFEATCFIWLICDGTKRHKICKHIFSLFNISI